MRIFFFIITFWAVTSLSFWVYVPLIILGIILFPLYIEAVFLGLMIDVLYGGAHGISFQFVFSFFATIFVLLAMPLRGYLRLKS